MKSRECKVRDCTNPVWSKGYCKNHTPKISIPSRRVVISSKKRKQKQEEVPVMRDFFLSIWNKRQHYSEVSNTYLGKEPLTVFFHHILPKEKYEEAKYDEENIILLTLDEHTNCESDVYRYEKINKRREYLLGKYG